MNTSVEQTIRDLATQHGVTATLTSLDHMGNAITRLAGDDVILDEIEMLIVHLGQAGHISGKDVLQLATAWQDEKRSI